MGEILLFQNNLTQEITLDGSSADRAAISSMSIKQVNPSATTGWYWINIEGNPQQFYVDMDYDGGGWVLVMAHPSGVSIPSVTWAQATSDTVVSSSGFTRGTSNPKDFAIHTGLPLWRKIVEANDNLQEAIYFVAGSKQELSGTHNFRSSWRWTGWGSNYNWLGASNLTNHVGGTNPGIWDGHITQNSNYTTFDNDNDSYSANCSSLYNNAPWWYGACWSGHIWGGNGGSGYANAAHWVGSSTSYNYGAIYVR